MNNMIKRIPTFILRLAILFLGLALLALCIFALPSIWKASSAEFPTASVAIYLIIIGLYVTTVPFYIALWQSLKLLRFIDESTVFSKSSLDSLRIIKYCALAIGILYIGGVPLLAPIAQADDAPGLLVFGFIIACVPFVVAAIFHLFEKLLEEAINLKSQI